MKDKSIVYTYHSQNLSFDRKDKKEITSIKNLIPTWLRADDASLAQATIKIAKAINKFLEMDKNRAVNGLIDKLYFNFQYEQEDNSPKYTLDINYRALDHDTFYTKVSYTQLADKTGVKVPHIQHLETRMPIEGLVARLRDQARVNSGFTNSPITANTKFGELIEIVAKAISEFSEGIVVSNTSFEDNTIMLSLMARNNHGRVMNIVISNEDEK